LSHPVGDRRDPQRTKFSLSFRNENLPDRLGVITPRAHPIPQRVEIFPQAVLERLDVFLIHTRRAIVGCHVLPGLPDETLGYLEGFGFGQRIIPVHGCRAALNRTRSCLRSTAITAPSSLLRMTPPLCCASVLSPLRGLRLSFFLIIATTASQVPHQCLKYRHATSMPDAIRPKLTSPSDSSRGNVETPVLTSIAIIDTSSMVHFRSSQYPLPDMGSHAVSPDVHHQRSLRSQLRLVWYPRLIGDTEGPTLITGATCHNTFLLL